MKIRLDSKEFEELGCLETYKIYSGYMIRFYIWKCIFKLYNENSNTLNFNQVRRIVKEYFNFTMNSRECFDKLMGIDENYNTSCDTTNDFFKNYKDILK